MKIIEKYALINYKPFKMIEYNISMWSYKDYF